MTGTGVEVSLSGSRGHQIPQKANLLFLEYWFCYIKRMVARKGQTQSCKSNKKMNEKFYNYINKQETKDSNNCVGEYKNVCEIEKKMFVVVLIGTS